MDTLQDLFIPNAEPVEPHACCAACDAEWPARLLMPIASEDVYALYTRDYSLNRDDGICPECMAYIAGAYLPRADVYSVYDLGQDAND